MKITILTALALSAVVSAAPASRDLNTWYNDPNKYYTPPPSTDNNSVACVWEQEHVDQISTPRYTIITEGPWTHPNEAFLANEIQHSCKLRKGNWKWAYGSRGEGEGVFKLGLLTESDCVGKAIDKAMVLKGVNGTMPAVTCVRGRKMNPLFREWHPLDTSRDKRGLKGTGDEVEVAKEQVPVVKKEESKRQRLWKRIHPTCIFFWKNARTCHKHKEKPRDP